MELELELNYCMESGTMDYLGIDSMDRSSAEVNCASVVFVSFKVLD